MEIRYCSACGNDITRGIPPDDHAERFHCASCGHVEYNNPIPLVLCLLHTSDKVLMIRRAIPPYVDSWAPPGGYIEQGESIDDAAVREIREEVGIEIDPESLMPYSIVSIPTINQICIICRSELPDEVCPRLGAEASEAEWFDRDNMPFDDYFLPAHKDGLKMFYASLRTGRFRVFMAEASYSDGFNRSVRVVRGERRETNDG